MNRRPRIVLLAAATALVLAFALVVLLDLLDRPATPSTAETSTTGTGASVAENARSSSGFDGALLPGESRPVISRSPTNAAGASP